MQTNLIEILTDYTINGDIIWINDNPITSTIYRSIQKKIEEVYCDRWVYTANNIKAILTEYNRNINKYELIIGEYIFTDVNSLAYAIKNKNKDKKEIDILETFIHGVYDNVHKNKKQ